MAELGYKPTWSDLRMTLGTITSPEIKNLIERIGRTRISTVEMLKKG